MGCENQTGQLVIAHILAEEPPYFDEKIRIPGRAWLQEHSHADRPKHYWRFCLPDLARAFRDLCGYTAMYEPSGTVDHYLSCKNYPELAYEWSNYRYISGWLNSVKQDADRQILDPFEVQDNWFELQLPSLLLTPTEHIPPEYKARAEFTLKRLKLVNGVNVMRQRQMWYNLYLSGKASLSLLDTLAPLLAEAIRRQAESTQTS